MIKTFIFDAEIDLENTYDLIENMDNFLADPDLNPETSCKIYFSTNGGAVYLAEILIDYFNNYPLELELVLTNACESAGIIVAAKTQRNISILPTAYGMIHKSSALLQTRDVNTKGTFDHFFDKMYGKALDEHYMDLYKALDLKDNELKIINNNKELYLTNKRLCETILGYRENTELKQRIAELKAELEFLEGHANDD